MDEIHPSFPSVAAALCRPNSLTGFMLCRKAEGRCVQRNKCRAEFQLLLAAHMVLSRSVMHQNINGSGLSKYFPLLMLFWGGREGKEYERKGKKGKGENILWHTVFQNSYQWHDQAAKKCS